VDEEGDDVELVGRSATDLAAAVGSGRVRAVEVVRAHLDHLARVEDRLNAFVVTRRGAALREAEALDGRADLDRLPLAGVPVAIKDVVDVAGAPTRLGSRATSARPAARDHELVARLRQAGAVVVGKTRCPELTLWGTSDDPDGIAVSPWDPTRSAGGSSGGSAAAVSAGVVPLALASDGLGSVRIPAAACGAVGIKPGADITPELLPDGSHHWFGMCRFGPIATTVADAALMLDVLAGTDRFRRVATVDGPLRVAVSLRSPLVAASVSRPWREAALEAGRLLRHAGHVVRRADPAYDTRVAQATIARWMQGAAHEVAVLGLDPDQLQPRTRAHVELGARLAGVAPVDPADAVRWRDRLAPLWDRHDVLVLPALARSPLRSTAWHRRSHAANLTANAVTAPFCAAWNLADLPAAVVPLWRDGGRPLAVQLVADRGNEELVLSVAASLEALAPWSRHAPGWGVRRRPDAVSVPAAVA
jgi:amidase